MKVNGRPREQEEPIPNRSQHTGSNWQHWSKDLSLKSIDGSCMSGMSTVRPQFNKFFSADRICLNSSLTGNMTKRRLHVRGGIWMSKGTEARAAQAVCTAVDFRRKLIQHFKDAGWHSPHFT